MLVKMTKKELSYVSNLIADMNRSSKVCNTNICWNPTHHHLNWAGALNEFKIARSLYKKLKA